MQKSKTGFEALNKSYLERLLNNKGLKISQHLSKFYAKLDNKEDADIYYVFLGESIKNEILAGMDPDTGEVDLSPIRAQHLRNNLNKKDQGIQNGYFNALVSLAFAQYAFNRDDLDVFFYYLFEAEQTIGTVTALNAPKINKLIKHESCSEGGNVRAENYNRKNEPIRQDIIKKYSDRSYKNRHGIKNREGFATHYTTLHNSKLQAENPEIHAKDLLKPSTVKKWLKESLDQIKNK